MQNNLSSAGKVKNWLQISEPADDLLLTRLIGSASRAIHTYLQRPTLFQNVNNEVYDGSGSRRQVLRQWPVLSVVSLTVGHTFISASSSYGQTGYALESWNGYPPGSPQALTLFGHSFCAGMSNVAVTYTSGYVISNEPWTVPSGGSAVPVNAPYGSWGANQGVTYANGDALALVTGTPTTGQYSVSNGNYTFASADAGQGVLISYSYIPGDIEQACIEIVGERYRTRDHIGQNSKTLGGQETVSYNTDSMNKYVRELLQPFKKAILC